MNKEAILQIWRDDAAKLAQVKTEADGTVEISLPYSTLSNAFVRVFVRETVPGTYQLSDGGDLYNDEYETTAERDVSGPFLQGKELLAKRAWSGSVRCQGNEFTAEASLHMLSARLFDLAEFIQLSVNLAYLSI